MSSTAFIFSALGGDVDLGSLVELYVAEMPRRIEALLKQYDDGNRHELRRAVHQLKGAAGSYGFHALTPAAAQLERSLDIDRPEEQIKAELDALLELCRRVVGGAPQ